MGPLARSVGALLLGILLGNCGRAGQTELRGEPGGWLAACLIDAECAEGDCVCGVCTTSCAERDCSAGPPGSECVAPGHWAHDAFCAGRSTEPICLSPCSEDGECGAADRCVEGVCIPEAAAESIEARLSPLCAVDPVVYRSLFVGDQRQLDLLTGCEVITGDLTLALFPDLNASALEALREVTGRLDVRRPLDEDTSLPLPTFPALEAVGELSLDGVELGTEPFPALRRLTRRDQVGDGAGRLAIRDCQGLTDLSAFGALEGIATLELSANPDLTRLNGLGDVTELRFLSLGANHGLTHLGGLGDTRALRTIEISGNDGLESLTGLALPAELRHVVVASNGRMQSVAGFESVTHVDSLEINSMTVLQTLEGLGSLESAGAIVIWDNPALVSLAGLTALREADSVDAARNPSLTALGDWAAIERLSRCTLAENPALHSLVGLGAAAMRSIEVWGASITDLSGLERASVESTLSLIDNTQLVTLSGAPTLGPNAEINVTNSASLADLSALSASTGLSRLQLRNTAVTDLDALANLVQLGGLVLEQNRNLTQIDAVGEVEGLVELVVKENSVLERLPSFPNVVTILTDQFPGYGALFVELVQNPTVVEGPAFPQVDRALAIQVIGNPSLARLTGFSRLEVVQEITIVDNSVLAEIDFSTLREAGTIAVDQNPLLGPEQLAPLSQIASGSEAEENP